MQQYQKPSPKAEVQQDKIWDASSDNRACVAGVAALYRLVKASQFELLRNEADVADVETDYRLSFYGKSPAKMLGYAACLAFDPQPLTELFIEGEGRFENYHTASGRSVHPDSIVAYEGFDQCSSHDTVLFIEKFEIASDRQGEGHGGRFLEQLLEFYDPGLVFLHARDKMAEKFFSSNGFEFSGLLNGSNDEQVMTLNRR